MKTTPLVSIILPVYNGAERIERAIKSVIEQLYSDWELLVVDDGSGDNTGDIVKNILKNDSRIGYIRNNSNLGIQKTLNLGLSEAKGKYIARIDDDDVWIDKEKLTRQVRFLEENGDYVLVGTGAIVVNENQTELFRYLPPMEDGEIRGKILSKNCFTHSSVMFDKDRAKALGGYSEREEVKHIEDYDLWLRLGTVGKFANIGKYSLSFTNREGALSNQNRVIQARRSLREIKKFRKEYPNFWVGYFFTLLRMLFFMAQKVVPVGENTLSRLKAPYKGF